MTIYVFRQSARGKAPLTPERAIALLCCCLSALFIGIIPDVESQADVTTVGADDYYDDYGTEQLPLQPWGEVADVGASGD